jgi:hypothetical protein
METWLPVPGYEGYYEVSDQGRVRSMPRTLLRVDGRPLPLRGRILKPTPNTDGYLHVGLCRGNKKRTRSVHALVLEAFVGPCPTGLEGCHENDVKSDNRLSNLRWDTRSANTYDRVRNGNHHSARKTECDKGHPFDEVNTYRAPNGNRHCRICRLAAKRRFEARLRLERQQRRAA